jgi:hypothetical protein
MVTLNHPWRMNKSTFNGTCELNGPHVVPNDDDIKCFF